MRRSVGIAVLLAFAAMACGRGAGPEDREQPREDPPAAQPTAEQAAEEAARGLEELGRELNALAGGDPADSKPVDPVSFRDLQALFPDLDGWEKGRPAGERMTSPFPFSQAEVTYTRGDARMQLRVVDSGLNQLLLTPYAMFLQAGYERETDDGYEKSTTVSGQPGWERWNAASRHGELNALVGKRYLVQIEGSDLPDLRSLHDLAGRIDMQRLAALQ